MRLLTLLAAVLALPAVAQIYSWEDEDGVHYTDDRSAVPKGVKASKDAVRAAPATATSAEPGASPRPGVSTELGVKERDWRDRFIAAHRAIDAKKRELSALEVSLPAKELCSQQQIAVPVVQVQTGRAQPVTTNQVQVVTQCAPNPMHDRVRLQIEQKQVEIREAELDLQQLERRASLEAVPREWRRGW